MFIINPANTQNIASRLSTKKGELDRCATEIGNLSNQMHGIAMGGIIALRIRAIKTQVKKEANMVKSLSDSLDQIAQIYQKTENGIFEGVPVWSGSGDKGTQGRPTNQELLNAADSEKDSVISEFEKTHPDEAKKLNEFLKGGKNNQLTEEDIRNIKYLAYTAEEPYRSIYINSIKNFKMGNVDTNDGAWYKPILHTLHYEYPESFGDDPRGGYTTFFHECGHAVDDLSEVSEWWGSDTESFKVYSGEMGREITLRDAIMYDVYYNEKNPHSMTSIAKQIISAGGEGSNGNIDNVIKALQTGNTKKLSNADLDLFNAVVDEHMSTTPGTEQYEAVSDVYGGVSKNNLRTNYGHENKYWNDKTNAGKELWAEFFSYNMAGDQEALQNLIEYFPESAYVLNEYAKALEKKLS